MATAIAPPTMPLVLDSDIFTDWRNQRPHAVQAITAYQLHFKVFPLLTVMTVFEARFGFENQLVKAAALPERFEQDRASMEKFVQVCGVLPFEERAANIAAYIWARLSQSDRNKHRADVFIAATALTHGYGLATRNQRDFELIGGCLPPANPILYLALWKAP